VKITTKIQRVYTVLLTEFGVTDRNLGRSKENEDSRKAE